MKGFELARQQARELRGIIGIEPEGLLPRLEKYLKDNYGVLSLWPVSLDAIDHGRAEVVPADRTIRYDRKLDDEPEEKLLAIAHEFGHLVRHRKLFDPHAKPDVLRDSKYTISDGAGAIARYSSRDAEELEATAFAKEFICPSELIFEEWRQNPTATSGALARKWGVPVYIVRTQLAEGLFDLSLRGSEEPETQASRRDISLNDLQRQAAEYCGGAALVNAGPGTGKTATLIMRVDYLLRAQKAAPEHILILTFSNEAAEELRERIGSRFNAEIASSIHMHTFHSFGYAQLLSNALHLPYDLTILDEIGQEELVHQLLGSVECDALIRLSDTRETVRLAVQQINHLKDRMCGQTELEAAITQWQAAEPDRHREQTRARDLLKLLCAYEQAKQEQKKVDFADLILLALATLAAHAQLVTALREQYQWVMVDEFQDVSVAMVQLLSVLCGAENPPWVVGDIRQAIYRFRGADPDENLRLFRATFPGAASFDLHVNYRSCNEVIAGANQMATLLAFPDLDTAGYEQFWERGAEHTAIGDVPVQVIRASSDTAEQEGIATLIEQWMKQHVKLSEIAVLARRNIDVRNIVLALGKRHIKATTSGLITPEGAAGDLAAVITLAVTPRPSIPRVVYCLGRQRFPPDVLNSVIRALLQQERERESTQDAEQWPAGSQHLIDEYQTLLEHLHREQFSGDAFTMLCVFLFDGSAYLRRMLADEDETARMLALSEILTTLTRAAGYRFTHPDLSPVASRRSFAQYFRENISSSKPVLAPPRSTGDAVRVMTCHASKGLQFPCVVVAGQTLSTARRDWWLPPALTPSADEDRKQADALLFVGLTRAQRAVVITYASAKTTGGTQRPLPDLLERWQERYTIPSREFPELARVRNTVSIKSLWDTRDGVQLSARKLGKNDRYCDLSTWLEDFVSIRFPLGLTSLYPRFFIAMRATLQQIVERAQVLGSRVGAEEAAALFLARCEDRAFAEHPHAALYRRMGLAHVRTFAEAYEPHPGEVRFFETDEMILTFDDALLPVRLDLVTYFQDGAGVTHAMLYRPESLGELCDGAYPKELNWSAMNDASKRVSLVMLRQRFPQMRFWVFSAADGTLYHYKPNRTAKNMDTEADAALVKLKGFTTGSFEVRVDERKCESCGVRISCPHWLGATG